MTQAHGDPVRQKPHMILFNGVDFEPTCFICTPGIRKDNIACAKSKWVQSPIKTATYLSLLKELWGNIIISNTKHVP